MTPPHATHTGRPPLGTPTVGDDVYVHDGGRNAAPIAAKVAVVGRVWLTIENPKTRRTWRLRKDTQNCGTGVGYGTSFVTPEQLRYDQHLAAARQVLRDQGISLQHDSPWRPDDRLIALADLVRQSLDGGDR